MTWSVKIGQIAGTAIRIHLTFLLFLIWIGFMHYQIGGAAAAWDGILFVILLFACVVLHEFGHVFAARRYGIRTPDITLLPIGGVARLERMPEKPVQELVVAIAGPLVNVVIAAALYLYLGQAITAENLESIEDPRLNSVARLAAANTFLVLFNAIPAFPMDGGRVLRALLAMRLGTVRATQIAATIGQGLAFVMGFIGLLYSPILLFIAIFVYLAATAEAHQVQMREVAAGVPVSEAMMTVFERLPPDAVLKNAVDVLLRTSQHEFPVMRGEDEVLGILTREDIIRGLRDKGPQGKVADTMHHHIPMIGHRQCLDQAFHRLQETGAPALGVTDSRGRMAGFITPETVAEMMMVWSAISDRPRFGPWRRRG